MPHSFGLVPHLSKTLIKLLPGQGCQCLSTYVKFFYPATFKKKSSSAATTRHMRAAFTHFLPNPKEEKKKKLAPVKFFLTRRPNHDTQNAEQTEKHIVFRPVHRRDHVSAHRTGFQDKKKKIFHSGRKPCSPQKAWTAAAWPGSERRRTKSTPPYHRIGCTRAKLPDALKTVSYRPRERSR